MTDVRSCPPTEHGAKTNSNRFGVTSAVATGDCLVAQKDWWSPSRGKIRGKIAVSFEIEPNITIRTLFCACTRDYIRDLAGYSKPTCSPCASVSVRDRLALKILLHASGNRISLHYQDTHTRAHTCIPKERLFRRVPSAKAESGSDQTISRRLLLRFSLSRISTCFCQNVHQTKKL